MAKKKRTGPKKGASGPLTLPPPPVGTYDPGIDYNAQASQRGYDYAAHDAQTAYEQGQQDYGLNLGDLTRQRDYTLSDLLTGRTRTFEDLDTSKTRLNQDYGFQTSELGRQYGILGRQQAERAAQQGITSQGLLRKSQQVRGENQKREQGQLDLSHNRGLEDIGTARTRVGEDYTTNVGRTNTAFQQGKTRLDLGNARTFGGFNGQTILNPLTGQPEFGSLLTSLTRAGAENAAYQGYSGTLRAQQAADMGYVSPLTQPDPKNPVSIGGQRVTPQMWQNGLLLDALLGR